MILQNSRFFKVSEKEYGKDTSEIILPARSTSGSAGYDFFAPCDIVLAPNEQCNVRTGIRARIDEGWVLMIFPRSGLGNKFGVRLRNTVGVIDSDYFGALNEGHIIIGLQNGDKELTIKKGTAFAQGVFLMYGIIADDNATETRKGGFGSTDKPVL